MNVISCQLSGGDDGTFKIVYIESTPKNNVNGWKNLQERGKKGA